jgi:hypothetical protein
VAPADKERYQAFSRGTLGTAIPAGILLGGGVGFTFYEWHFEKLFFPKHRPLSTQPGARARSSFLRIGALR